MPISPPPTIALTVQPATASVLVQVTTSSPDPVTITRTDANGTHLVRLRAGQAPIGGALAVTDYEAALTGPIVYDVAESTGAHAAASTTLAGVESLPRFAGVQMPQHSVTAEMVTGYSAARLTGSSTYPVIGRPHPIVVLGAGRTRQGTLEAWCSTFARALALQSTLSAARVVQFRQANQPGMDMYLTVDAVTIEPIERMADGWRWRARIDYSETLYPSLPLLGDAGWTLDDVAGLGTYAAIRSDYADLADLLAGPS